MNGRSYIQPEQRWVACPNQDVAYGGTKPGFHLLVGPGWKGEVPKGITQVFRATTNTAFVVPRVFMDDTPEDRQAIQPVLSGIDMYPLAEFDGTMKSRDWSKLPALKSPTGDDGSGETK